jgi:hypothetical protein
LASLCQQKKGKGEQLPLEIEGARGEARLTSNWRIPASSSLRVGGTSATPSGASVVPAGTSSDSPAAGDSAPASGIDSTAAPAALGDGGAGSHLSEVVRSPSLSSSSFDDEFASAGGGESPWCSRSRYSSLCCSRRSHRLIFFSFMRAARSCSRCCAVRSAARARGVGGSDRAAFTVTNCGQRSSRQTEIQYKDPKGKEETHSPAGRREASRMTRGCRCCATPT